MWVENTILKRWLQFVCRIVEVRPSTVTLFYFHTIASSGKHYISSSFHILVPNVTSNTTTILKFNNLTQKDVKIKNKDVTYTILRNSCVKLLRNLNLHSAYIECVNRRSNHIPFRWYETTQVSFNIIQNYFL